MNNDHYPISAALLDTVLGVGLVEVSVVCDCVWLCVAEKDTGRSSVADVHV